MVYVDQHCHWTQERCHLIADSPEELRAAARWLGISLGFVQYQGTRDEHFDILQAERRMLLARPARYDGERVRELTNGQLYRHVKARTNRDYQAGIPCIRYARISQTVSWKPEDGVPSERR